MNFSAIINTYDSWIEDADKIDNEACQLDGDIGDYYKNNN